jgi:hypothetical protein
VALTARRTRVRGTVSRLCQKTAGSLPPRVLRPKPLLADLGHSGARQSSCAGWGVDDGAGT